MKGTKLWQGPGSPLIQGRSRQIRPLWQPWLVAVFLTLAMCNIVTWLWFSASSPDFFLVGAMLGSLAGVWLSKTMGFKARWIMGTTFGVVLNAMLFAAVLHWAPMVVWHLGKVG